MKKFDFIPDKQKQNLNMPYKRLWIAYYTAVVRPKYSSSLLKKHLSLIAMLFQFVLKCIAQDTLSVLFIGNSYTYYNNLPQLVQNLSAAVGKTLIIDSSMPGGYTISNHLTDATTTSKISQGNWDYVIVQEQSQVPTIDYFRYTSMYPSLTSLKSMIEQYNPCTKIITYMTWGRRFGGQQCDPSGVYCSPVFTDFDHMQDSLTSAYMGISTALKIQCAPVGVAWQKVLNDTNLVLHTTDNSHPALDGSYLAACVLFSSIWKIPSTGISYTAGMDVALANYYQQNSDHTLFNDLRDWNLHINTPDATFIHSTAAKTVTFTNLSVSKNGGELTYYWSFGDGDTSSQQNPVHTYITTGTYTVRLVATNCSYADTLTKTVTINTTGTDEKLDTYSRVYPNPVDNELAYFIDDRLIGSTYVLYDLYGRKLLTGKINDTQNKINLQGLPGNIYYLQIGEQVKDMIKIIRQ